MEPPAIPGRFRGGTASWTFTLPYQTPLPTVGRYTIGPIKDSAVYFSDLTFPCPSVYGIDPTSSAVLTPFRGTLGITGVTPEEIECPFRVTGAYAHAEDIYCLDGQVGRGLDPGLTSPSDTDSPRHGSRELSAMCERTGVSGGWPAGLSEPGTVGSGDVMQTVELLHRRRILRTGVAMVLAVVGSSLVLSHRLTAQSCFTAHPFPHCRSYWLTEAGLGARLDPRHGKSPVLLTLELGYMANTTARSAFGATIFAQNTGIGIRPRYRRWLTREVSLDIAPGLVLKPFDDTENKAPVFSGQVALNVGPLLAVMSEVDMTCSHVYPMYQHSTDVAWYAGGRFGGGLGLTGILGCLAVGTYLLISWDGYSW